MVYFMILNQSKLNTIKQVRQCCGLNVQKVIITYLLGGSKMSLNNADKLYLEQYISSIQLVSASSLEMGYDVTDLDFRIIAKSQQNKYGTRRTNDTLDKFRNVTSLDFYRQKSITQQRVIKILAVSLLPDTGTFLTVVSWRPVYNAETGNIIALLCLAHNLEVFNLVDILRRFYKTGNLISPRPINLQLTEREKQVIFFFLLNLDSRSIAEILTKIENKKISESSINHMFNQQLFPKFEVFNRKALYDKLIDSGYSRLMPKNILNEDIIFEITDYIQLD